VKRVFDRRGLDEHARRPLQKILAFLVLFAGVTLAIGFALRDVIKNVVAGVFSYTDKPFRIGDRTERNGNSGVVEDISFRVARVRTFDKELLTVPNHALTSDVV
jgi:small-conductance mechanosensitive channel